LYAFARNDLHSPYVLVVGEEVVRGVRLRGLGFLQDPNDFGQQLLVALALMPVLTRKDQLFTKFFLCLTVPLFLYAIYLTQSRGTLMGLGVLILCWAQKRIGKFKSTLLTIVLTGSYLFFGFASDRGFSVNEASSANRVALWGEGIQMFLHSPLFGEGYRSFADAARQTAHNSFVLCFAELGLFGYVFWMTLIVLAFKQLKQVLSTQSAPDADPEIIRVATALRNAFIVFLVTGWFLSRTYVVTFYLLCGAIQVLLHLHQQKVAGPMFRINMPKVLALSGALQFASLIIVYMMVRVHWLMR
jgi:O-antigen ligase